jgi:capsular exopolysaccharide synthesis family protein
MQYANANPNLRNGNNRRREGPGTLETLVRAVRRNWLLPVLLPIVVIAAAAIALNYVTKVYQASAQLRIDQQRSNVAVLDALQSLSSGSQIETEMVVLRSRTLAESVIDSLALRATMLAPRGEPRARYFERLVVHRNATAGEWIIRATERGTEVVRAGGPGDVRLFGRGEVLRFDGLELQLTREGQEAAEIRLDVAPLTEAVRRFQRTLVVTRPSREADVVRITYEGADSVVVPEVVNTVVRHFIRRRQAEQSTEAVDMVRFLTEQIDTLSRQLVVAEAALQDFGERSGVVAMTAQAETQVGRLADMKAQRDLFDAERRSLQALVSNERGASSSLRDVVGFHTILKSPSGSELLRALNEAENVRAQMLQRYTPDNPDVQLQSQRIEELEEQLRGIAGSYLQGLNESVHALDDMLDEYSDELRRIPEQEITLARLKRQTTVLEDIHMLLQTRVKEAQIAAAVHDASVRLVDPAVVPGRPIRPRPMVSLAFATMLGIGMGLAGAVLREHLDRTVRTRDELQARMPGLPILSVIPRSPARQNGALVNVVERESPSAEAYRQLRTNLAFSTPDKPQHVIVMTSPTPGDGKSMTSANLAATLAQQGLRCLLIDADMRRGSLHDAFGEPRDPGLSQVLANQVAFNAAVRTVALPSGGSLDLLPGGVHPPNPAELVGSTRLKAMLDVCRERYDLVILDAPPLNLVTDASIMATVADGVLVVVRAGVTRRDALEFAMDQLETVRAPLTGLVLNDVDLKAEGYYGGYEGYYGRRDAEVPGMISRIVRGQRTPRR